MPRHIIFLLLIIYINVICIHQIYADGISMTSRNIHMNSIVENKNDFNRLKAEEINTKAMEIEATSVKDALQLLLEAYKLDPTNWMINANLANVYSNFEQRYSLELSSEKRIEYRKQIFFFSEKALKLNPDHPGLLNNHGILLKEYNERHKAIEVLKKNNSIRSYDIRSTFRFIRYIFRNWRNGKSCQSISYCDENTEKSKY